MMNETVGVILSAGRGSRMKSLTDQKPKCLLELAGQPLLHWQLAALRQAGLKRIVVVRGYRAETLVGDFETAENPRWEQTNMVQTLLCALPTVGPRSIVVSYADIVYKPDHIRALMVAKGDIALTYDRDWEALWRLRNENPLDDAETFREMDGKLLEIGGKTTDIRDIQGQYMGLLKFTTAGQNTVQNYLNTLPPAVADKLDMTSLLRGLLGLGTAITAVPVSGGWCEADTEEDIHLYEQQLTTPGLWSHDWR